MQSGPRHFLGSSVIKVGFEHQRRKGFCLVGYSSAVGHLAVVLSHILAHILDQIFPAISRLLEKRRNILVGFAVAHVCATAARSRSV